MKYGATACRRAEAPERVAADDAARVEADDVEPVADVLGEQERPGPDDEVDPEPPGPPGLMNSEPSRSAGLAAGSRTIAIEILAPFGLS